MLRGLCGFVVTLALVLLGPGAGAQGVEAYPSKPIRVLVGFAPGGPTDIVARVVGQKLSEVWKQQVIVENRPSASGILATQLVAKSPPDGYTVLVNSTAYAVTPAVSKNAGYDAEKDLVPVIVVGSSPNIFIVHPSVKASTMREFIDLAKSGSFNYGTAGVGVTPHLSAELLFRLIAKIDVTHVPYNGGAPALAAVVAGHIQAASLAMPPAVPMIQSGQVRALAVTGSKRVAVLPNVPTVAESGYPEIEDYTWIAYFLPAGTPPAIVGKFNAEVAAAMKQPDVTERLARAGFDPVGGSPSETAAFVAAEIRKWAKVVKDVGVTID